VSVVVSTMRGVGRDASRPIIPVPVSQRLFFGAVSLLFAVCAALTILSCASLPALGVLQLCSGATMSAAWMRMPGQSWFGAASSFVVMWDVMMVAMMLPALLPSLWRKQQVGESNFAGALLGAGYFLVWTLAGLAVFPLGAALAAMAPQLPVLARFGPGAVVLVAGALQFTVWKARHLACCREEGGAHAGTTSEQGLRQGVRLGLHCCLCSVGPTAILLVLGVMDLRVMAAVTVAVAAERWAPSGPRTARVTGAIGLATGLFLLVQAARF
jgi:predicted metal-binding membrane protein